MYKKYLIIPVAIISLFLTSCHNSNQRSFNQLETKQIETIVMHTIRNHPELLLDAIKNYGKKALFEKILKTAAIKKKTGQPTNLINYQQKST